jgi:hypothetical protein
VAYPYEIPSRGGVLSRGDGAAYDGLAARQGDSRGYVAVVLTVK